MSGTTSSDDTGSEDFASMKKILMDTKVDGKKSVWTATLETFGMADGKTKKHDVIVNDLEKGIKLLNEYVTETQKNDPANLYWALVPLAQFGASKEDFLASFLKWAQKDFCSQDAEKPKKIEINVSKALRRVDAYFQWMNDNYKDLKEPLTVDSISAAAKVWDIQVTYDEKGQFVWWIDMGAMDRDAIKALDSKDHLRYIVWFAHLVMFDEKARNNGALIVEDMGHIGFWKMATLLPHDLSVKMDRLTIGILPVKMKAIYVFGAATWMTMLMTFMKPFMGKKMRDRMVLLCKKTDMQTFCDDLVTRANIPQDFCKIQGDAQRDTVFKSIASKQ